MSDGNISVVPVWNIPRANPGYLYIVQANERLKIGKSKDRLSRLRAAKTWLPDMMLVGVKPFWLVDRFEKDLHEGLAQWWYEGEWFVPAGDPYLEDFISSFRAFSDEDSDRDMNSVNFIYWMHDMMEIFMERTSRRQTLRAFQRDLSGVAKRRD